MPRVFAALLLPHEACDALARDAKAFARYDALARFAPSTNLHLTLAFLGEVPMDDALSLAAAIRPLAALAPRTVTISRIGVFERPRILYAACTPAEALNEVAEAVRREIRARGLPLDEKPFRAHITLARNWRRGYPPMTLPERTVRLIGPVLMESERDPRTGAVRYRQLY